MMEVKKELYILVSEKKWHKNLLNDLIEKQSNYEWVLIDNKKDFNNENIKKLNPSKIFFPHWSYLIPSDIYDNYECIVFHMTDLPYGRGGSPLQNLIVLGHTTTQMSALKVEQGIDSGDIYLKQELSLAGNATDIFERASIIIGVMINKIINHNIIPTKQIGDVVTFNRRTPEMSNLDTLDSISKIYDYIRMLDAEGYPNAFIENDFFKFEFTNAVIKDDKIIEANVRIIKK